MWQLKLFYLKESQIKDFDFGPLEELYLLHNFEQVARRRLLAKQNQSTYALSQPLVDFLKENPPWEIKALREYQAKRIELTKQCLTKLPKIKQPSDKEDFKDLSNKQP